MIPLGPFVTVGAWAIVISSIAAAHARSRSCPLVYLVTIFELVPAIVAIVFIQLLLDMYRPHFGDAVIAGVHAVTAAVVVALLRRRRKRMRSETGEELTGK